MQLADSRQVYRVSQLTVMYTCVQGATELNSYHFQPQDNARPFFQLLNKEYLIRLICAVVFPNILMQTVHFHDKWLKIYQVKNFVQMSLNTLRRQADRQTDRQTERERERERDYLWWVSWLSCSSVSQVDWLRWVHTCPTVTSSSSSSSPPPPPPSAAAAAA